jgi:hypothetical protein
MCRTTSGSPNKAVLASISPVWKGRRDNLLLLRTKGRSAGNWAGVACSYHLARIAAVMLSGTVGKREQDHERGGADHDCPDGDREVQAVHGRPSSGSGKADAEGAADLWLTPRAPPSEPVIKCNTDFGIA